MAEALGMIECRCFPAMVEAARLVTLYQPSMIVSVMWMAKPATKLPIRGTPSRKSPRAWAP